MRTTFFKTLAVLLTLGLALSGCFATTGEKMMDKPMTPPMETMEKGNMESGMSDTMR